MNIQLLNALVKAHLAIWGSITGARKPENLYNQAAYREILQPLSGSPYEKGGQIAESILVDIAEWNPDFRLDDLQPSVVQCRVVAAILFNFKKLKLNGTYRKQEGILKFGWDKGVESWRSHDGGITGPEVDFARDLALHQLRKRKLN
jgi:hypothetical protein